METTPEGAVREAARLRYLPGSLAGCHHIAGGNRIIGFPRRRPLGRRHVIAFDRPAPGKPPERNVLGGELANCSSEPLTGFFRDGCCRTGPDDVGVHTVCAVMTAEFLEFTVAAGNDLVTPRPQWGFPGLVVGDRWCLCAARWLEAAEAGKAPPVVLEATHEKSLAIVPRNLLERHAVKTQ